MKYKSKLEPYRCPYCKATVLPIEENGEYRCPICNKNVDSFYYIYLIEEDIRKEEERKQKIKDALIFITVLTLSCLFIFLTLGFLVR